MFIVMQAVSANSDRSGIFGFHDKACATSLKSTYHPSCFSWGNFYCATVELRHVFYKFVRREKKLLKIILVLQGH